MAQAVSTEIESVFYSVSSSDLLSSWFGESEKLIKELFQHARSTDRKAIVFIDEIDSLCRKRDSKEAEATRRVKTELLKQMEGAGDERGKDIFLLCATNCPWDIDSAFLRRFEKRIYIGLPGRDARKQLIDIHLGDVQVSLTEKEWERVINRTEGFSGSDLATCASDALLEPVREIQNCKLWKWSEDKTFLMPASEGEAGSIGLRLESIPKEKVQPRAIMFDDLMKALNANHRTVSQQELDRYNEFTESYGHVG